MLFFLIFRTFLIRSSIRSRIPSKDSEGEKLSRNSPPVTAAAYFSSLISNSPDFSFFFAISYRLTASVSQQLNQFQPFPRQLP